jgi:hypothetical protein
MLIAAGLLLLVAESATPTTAVEQVAKVEDTQLICKQTAKTNTRFGKKTCRTKAEWAAIAEQNRRVMEEEMSKPGGYSTSEH